MSDCHAQGRLGTTISRLSITSIQQLLYNSDVYNDPLFRGESLAAIKHRYEFLTKKQINEGIKNEIRSCSY